jgi:CubicO group peptidase (beta-lactamase class C family)
VVGVRLGARDLAPGSTGPVRVVAEKGLPMKTDAIFRIASITKPVVSVAAMMLVEQGKIQLITPVSEYLPEFKAQKVGVDGVNEATGRLELALEPARREMTVHDLVRHTSGLTSAVFGDSLVKQLYRAENVTASDQTLAEVVSRLARLPLAHQPGTTFEYGLSTDVLGRIVEVASGMSLDQFITTRITRPLGMADSGFYVSGLQGCPSRRAASGSADRPAAGDARRDEPAQVAFGRRWHGIDRGRLRTLLPDAAQRRRTRRCARARAEDPRSNSGQGAQELSDRSGAPSACAWKNGLCAPSRLRPASRRERLGGDTQRHHVCLRSRASGPGRHCRIPTERFARSTPFGTVAGDLMPSRRSDAREASSGPGEGA